LNTRTDQLPNYNVIADAWQGSKEANMIASGLELAMTQAGLNWEDDILPWLGERVALGIVDMGNQEKTQTGTTQYRAPLFVVAAQTKDRAKSDAALANAFKQISQRNKGTIETETYRGIPISYVKSNNEAMPETGAYATVNDVVVLAPGTEQLHAAINAALDGQNLSTNANYKTVMSALPDQTVGAMYLDYNRYVELLMELNKNLQSRLDSATANLDPQQAEKLKQQREKLQQRQEAQLAQLQEMMKAVGALGGAMSYEPTGIRFDTAMQFDPAQLPASQRQVYESALTPASGRLFASLPATAIMAVDFNLKGGFMKAILNPDVLAAQFAALGVTSNDIAAKLDEFQKATGVNLQTDVLDLINGDAGFAILARDQERSDVPSSSMPVEIALLVDSSDANQLKSSFEKVLQSVSALSGKGNVKTQSLSGLPYSVITVDDKPMLTYGVVDNRFVIGTDSNTLLGIDHVDQASLANDAIFKQATGLLPTDRLNTAYLNFQPVWNLISSRFNGDSSTDAKGVLNYLGHFKWLASGAEAPANGLARASLHIGVGK
jgi:hypothetical protein